MKQIRVSNQPLLVFGGVYSNLQALEALKAAADAHSIPASQIICTGDIAGYCAQPEECFNLVRSWGIHTIAGNVEVQLRDDEEDCGCDFRDGSRCDVFSRQWFPYTRAAISSATRDWLQSVPLHLAFEWQNLRFVVVHGSLQGISDYVFKSTSWNKKAETLDAANAQVVLAGHAGLPFFDSTANSCWLNPGVIGMPANNGQPSVWYALLQPTANGFQAEFKQLAYDYHTASKLMEEQNLPCEYATTLRTGIWDNCEILPPAETAQQGQPIAIRSVDFLPIG